MQIWGDKAMRTSRSAALAGASVGPTGFFLLLVSYFALQIFARVAVSPGVELDEGEQVILTQQWSWGYDAQGPLFTWIQRLFFDLFGVSVLSLALLKNVLLAATYSLVYACARKVTGRHALGVAAVVFIFMTPAFLWEAQRDLTHTVLATALAAATLLLFLKLGEVRSLWVFPALGMCAGLGVMAKGNYILFLAGLVMAGLTLGKFRRNLLQPRALLAVTSFVLVLLPYALWMSRHLELAFPSIATFSSRASGHWLTARLVGLGEMLGAMLALFSLPLAIFLGISLIPFPPRLLSVFRLNSDAERLIVRQMLFVTVSLFGAVLVLGVSYFKVRWFQPILIGLPVLTVAVLRERLTPVCIRIVVAGGVITAVTVLMLMPGHLWLSSWRGRPFRLNAPFTELAARMHDIAPNAVLVIAENRWIGGNLRLRFPETTVVVPELSVPAIPSAGPCVIVWNATANERPPKRLLEFARSVAHFESSATVARFVDAPYRYYPVARMRLGLILGETRKQNSSASRVSAPWIKTVAALE